MSQSNKDDNDIDGYFSSERVTASADGLELADDSYRDHLYDRDDPILADSRGMDYEQFTADRYRAPFLRDLLRSWQALYEEPFVGVTNDGRVREGLYPLGDRAAPVDVARETAMVRAAQRALAVLSERERDAFSYPLDAPQWRAWSNPEFVIHRVGVRLENLTSVQADAVLALVEASLSTVGYDMVREAMSLNGFLGELVDLPRVMNTGSYWVSLFGEPRIGGAWGWQLFGHHVAVNFITVAGRHVVSPVFLGAEPALSEAEHPPIFAARESLALELAGSLTAAQRERAVVYSSVLDPAMPAGRVHPADERHVAGAFHDNRVIPYEGIQGVEFDEHERTLVLELAENFLILLADEQRAATMRTVADHLDETWISWYGATDGSEPFYLRVQSPVILAELDHHAGVWLSNRLPAKFHVHSTLRLPNGNDYGKKYLEQLGPANS